MLEIAEPGTGAGQDTIGTRSVRTCVPTRERDHLRSSSLLRPHQLLGFLKQLLGFPVERQLLHHIAQPAERGGGFGFLAELKLRHGQKRQVGGTGTLVAGGVEHIEQGQSLQVRGMLAVAILSDPERSEKEAVLGLLAAGGFRLANGQGIGARCAPRIRERPTSSPR